MAPLYFFTVLLSHLSPPKGTGGGQQESMELRVRLAVGKLQGLMQGLTIAGRGELQGGPTAFQPCLWGCHLAADAGREVQSLLPRSHFRAGPPSPPALATQPDRCPGHNFLGRRGPVGALPTSGRQSGGISQPLAGARLLHLLSWKIEILGLCRI